MTDVLVGGNPPEPAWGGCQRPHLWFVSAPRPSPSSEAVVIFLEDKDGMR